MLYYQLEMSSIEFDFNITYECLKNSTQIMFHLCKGQKINQNDKICTTLCTPDFSDSFLFILIHFDNQK